MRITIWFSLAALLCSAYSSAQIQTPAHALHQKTNELIRANYWRSGQGLAPERSAFAEQETELARRQDMLGNELPNDAVRSTESAKLARILSWSEMVLKELQATSKINGALMGADYDSLASFDNASCRAAQDIQSGQFKTQLDNDDLWFSVVTDHKKSIVIDSVGSDIDTQITVYDDCSHTAPSFFSDDALGVFAQLTIDPTNRPNRYFVKVSSVETGRAQVKVSLVGERITGTVQIPIGTNDGASTSIAVYQLSGNFLSFVANGFVSSGNSTGNYSVSVAPGTYYVVAQRSFGALLDQIYSGVNCVRVNQNNPSSSICNVLSGSTVTVPPDETVLNINFSLVVGGSISGRVLGLAANETARVAIAGLNGIEFAERTTDATGRFTFERLIQGTYFARATGSSFNPQLYNNVNCQLALLCNFTGGTPIVLAPQANLSNIDFQPRRLPTISGMVQAGTNSNTGVTVYSLEGNFVQQAFANNISGSYQISLQPNRYRIVFFASGFRSEIFNNIECLGTGFSSCTNLVSGTIIDLTSNLSFTANAVLEQLPSISGRVVDQSNLPISNAEILLCGASTTSSCFRSASTSSDGRYSLNNIASGSYTLLARSAQYIDEAYPDISCQQPVGQSCIPALAGAQVIPLTSGPVENIDFQLSLGGTISGNITGVNQFGGFSLEAFRQGTTTGPYQRIFSFSESNRYSLGDLINGDYRLLLESDGSFSQLYPNINCVDACNLSLASPISITEGQSVTGINFDLLNRVSISGRVTEAGSGRPLENVPIDLWSATNLQRLSSTVTDLNGRYSFNQQFFSQSGLFISTDAPASHFNRIHQTIECAQGSSAFARNCSFTGALALVRPASTPSDLGDVNFSLRRAPAQGQLFSDGFED